MSRVVSSLTITLLVVGLVAAARCSRFEGDISTKPLRSAGSGSLGPSECTAALRASIPYNALAAKLNTTFPQSFETNGCQQVCVDPTDTVQKEITKLVGGDIADFLSEVMAKATDEGSKICQDVAYIVSIVRPGGFSVTRQGERLRVSTSIDVSGHAGFSGDLAKALALDRKNFRGSVVVWADITADITPDWSPNLSGLAGFSWTNKAEFEIVHDVWLHVDGTVGPQLQAALDKAIDEASRGMSGDEIRNAVSPHWRSHDLELQVSQTPHAVAAVSITPQSAGFTGITYGDDALLLAVNVGADVRVDLSHGGEPALQETAQLALPRLDRILADSDYVRLTLPLRVSYALLETALADGLVGREFEAETPIGKATVTVKETALYPAGEKLAIGVRADVDFKRRFLDVSGWLYLTGDPVLQPDEQRIRVRELEFTRMLDNELWEAFTASLRGPITQAIESSATYEYSSDVAALRTEINREAARVSVGDGFTLGLVDTSLAVNRILLGRDTLDLEVAIGGRASIVVGSLQL